MVQVEEEPVALGCARVTGHSFLARTESTLVLPSRPSPRCCDVGLILWFKEQILAVAIHLIQISLK
jgi:hypothetical protein